MTVRFDCSVVYNAPDKILNRQKLARIFFFNTLNVAFILTGRIKTKVHVEQAGLCKHVKSPCTVRYK